ncbi:unnamed protein product, partial [Echinostoma caproni]|uniref:Ovary overexpressed n=1 Tax=Echinostoma caproni TaxID=27848 RepID=A0A183AZH3_9TREM
MYKLIRRCFGACCHRGRVQSEQCTTSAHPVDAWDHVTTSSKLAKPPPTWSDAASHQRSITDDEAGPANGMATATANPTVMCRLVRRYIHQSKKTMRQDGVNEDDLLEIKQDISSLRYELREDRKREVARTIGHLEGLKRDLLEELNKQFTDTKQLLSQYRFLSATRSTDVLPVAPDELTLVRGTTPPLLTKLVGTEPSRSGGPVRSYSVTQASDQPQTCSLTYGRETQHIYDEIKQLALMNTAYEGPAYESGSQLIERHLPIHTYAQLKFEILRGVRTELQQLVQELKNPDSKDSSQGSAISERDTTRTSVDSPHVQWYTS